MSSSLFKRLVILSTALLAGLLLFFLTGEQESASGRHEVFGASDIGRASLDDPGAPAVDMVRGDSGALEEREAIPLTEEELEEARFADLDRSLRGRVIDEKGRPIADARVLVAQDQGWLTIPLGTEEIVGINSWRQSKEVTSDEEGRFVFEELKSGIYDLEARAAAYAASELEELSFSAAEGLDVGDVVLGAGAVLRGRVVDENGVGVAGAILLESLGHPSGRGETSLPGRGCPLGESGPGGRFELSNLDPGPLHLIVDSPEHSPVEVKCQAHAANKSGMDLRVTLRSGFPLEGRVVGLDAERLALLRIIARRSDPDSLKNLDAEELAVADRPRIVGCEESGAFRVGGLAAGVRYRLTAYEASPETGRVADRLAELEPTYAQPGDKEVLLSLKRPSSLSFRVVDDVTGSPLTEFHALAGFESLGSLEEGGETRRRHPGGVVRFDKLRRGEDSSEAQLEVRALGYKRHRREGIELAEEEHLDLGDVRMLRAPCLTVKVEDAETGRPVPGAYVMHGVTGWRDNMIKQASSLSRESEFKSQSMGAPAGPDGVATLELFHEGDSLIVVGAPGYAPFVSEPQSFAAEEAVSFTAGLKRGGSVEVQLLDSVGKPVAGVFVLKHRFRENEQTEAWVQLDPAWKSDENGIVRFEPLEAGEYGFRVHDETQGSMQNYVTLSADQDWTRTIVEDGQVHEVTLATHARSSLQGTLTELGRPLASAVLNLVELKDGEPIDSGNEMVFFGMGGADPNEATSDEHGHFEFSSVKPGEYRMSIGHPSRYMASAVELTVHREPTYKDIDLNLTTIEGRVTDPDGVPLAGIRVTASSPGEVPGQQWRPGGLELSEDEEGETVFQMNQSNSIQLGGTSAKTDSDGRYLLRGIEPWEEVTVYAQEDLRLTGTAQLRDVREGEARRDVDFSLAAAGVLELTVKGLSEEESYLQVGLSFLGEGEGKGSRSSSSVSPWSTTAVLNSLAPGSWRLKLTSQAAEEVHSRDITLQAGERLQLVLDL